MTKTARTHQQTLTEMYDILKGAGTLTGTTTDNTGITIESWKCAGMELTVLRTDIVTTIYNTHENIMFVAAD